MSHGQLDDLQTLSLMTLNSVVGKIIFCPGPAQIAIVGNCFRRSLQLFYFCWWILETQGFHMALLFYLFFLSGCKSTA
jgi:hypothetical protein